jgi:hypothetical protein
MFIRILLVKDKRAVAEDSEFSDTDDVDNLPLYMRKSVLL